MSSKGVLYVIISGPNHYQRAIEGLRIAEYQSGDGSHGVALMLQGEGVDSVMIDEGALGVGASYVSDNLFEILKNITIITRCS